MSVSKSFYRIPSCDWESGNAEAPGLIDIQVESMFAQKQLWERAQRIDAEKDAAKKEKDVPKEMTKKDITEMADYVRKLDEYARDGQPWPKAGGDK